ncbi:hypothetical protein ACQ4PT_042941 [Festuca glaucescens]
MSSPAWIWNVSYSSVEDLDNGVHNLLDGELHLWPAKQWIALMDAKGTPIIGKFLQKDDDVLEVGSVVEFSAFHALVDHCIVSPQEDQVVIDQVPLADPKFMDRHWTVTYSTSTDLSRGRLKAYDGTLGLIVKDNWLVLKNAKGTVIGRRGAKSKDLFSIGAKILFPNHVIQLGVPLVISNAGSPQRTLQRGLAALKSKAPRSALAKSHVMGKKLEFAKTIQYEACLGYQCPDSAPNQETDTASHIHSSDSAKSSEVSQVEETVSGSGPDTDVSHEQAQKDFDKLVDDMVYKGPSYNPKPPPDLTAPASSEEMAVFEVDPLPWLPWGHQIIDGGPTRLPRTYYYAAQDPPMQHQSYYIATVDPPPPPQGEAFWREQVHNFLVGPLQRNVISSQPSLFGAGLFELSSPNSVNALVQHGQYQIQNRTLRFLHVGDAPQNHRAALGFCRGWLMFLGVHPDYRNNLDIANVVSTFGQYHTWNSNDPVKDRVLVYASFPSPQLVPRYVVFGKFAMVGGVKESWTTPVYILTADFADVLPADEDQMPPDGNPHPFPDSDILQGQASRPMENREVPLSTPKRKRARKSETPMVQLSERRFTRSCLSKDGYRPKPLLEVEPKIKKKPRAKMLLVNSSTTEKEVPQGNMAEEDTGDQIPITPMHVMQRVGAALGIAPEKLTKDQLEADPMEKETAKDNDD